MSDAPLHPFHQVDDETRSFLDLTEFSLRDTERIAHGIYLSFSRIHPEEITPQTIDQFHSLIEQWYRSHRNWISVCRSRCREIESKSALVQSSLDAAGSASVSIHTPAASLEDWYLWKFSNQLFTACFLVFLSLVFVAMGLISIGLAFKLTSQLLGA